ncbi:hypothetical protein EV13_1705 [Prochlorococcus sp. MIT 0702]|nr:hypothetical protein EV12_2212 [Prochlorococcus sp. MIT 0701]KGG28046.1 hypothetical protein EV13_1705 [Prochlorococcus sp. MIT 0702]KGG33651.1 hypothetical protein EV14_1601 [Prochlorococcus sp. MIT 0703]
MLATRSLISAKKMLLLFLSRRGQDLQKIKPLFGTLCR